MEDEDNNWRKLAVRTLKQVSPTVRDKAGINFFVHAGILAPTYRRRTEEKYGVHIPCPLSTQISALNSGVGFGLIKSVIGGSSAATPICETPRRISNATPSTSHLLWLFNTFIRPFLHFLVYDTL
jgi:hypothetical protein